MIGDPTESSALGTFFHETGKQIYIGSVKTNIGHLEAAAGVAAVIKVLLMMNNKTIVPSLWYTKENENPKLKLKDFGLVVPTSCIPWDIPANQIRFACVNSFGFGGTNAHAVIKQVQRDTKEANKKSAIGIIPPIIVISANDEASLYLCSKQLCSRIQNKNYNISSLAWTSTCRRDHRPKRKAFLVESVSDLVTECQRFVKENPSARKYAVDKNIVFVFCGVGTTWNQMGQSLLKNRIFENKIDEIDSYLLPLAGWKVKEKLKLNDDSVVNDPFVGHIAIFAYQVGLTYVWEHFGITPDLIIGQSVGEVAAAHIAGFVDLETAVRVIYFRSKILASVNIGTMVVFKSVDTNLLENYCKGTKSLNVAVYSSPVACVAAGEEKELKDMEEYLREKAKKQFKVIKLEVRCAYHSKAVDKAAKEVCVAIGQIRIKTPKTQVISTVTGELVKNGLFGQSDYWAKNVRKPVQFGQAIQKAHSKHKHTIYIEIGPKPVLAAHVQDIFSNIENISAISSVKPNLESQTLAKSLCLLYEYGLDLKWQNVFESAWIPDDLPVYTGQKIKSLYQSQVAKQQLKGPQLVNSSDLTYMNMEKSDSSEVDSQVKVTISNTPYVYEHKIAGALLLPGSFYAEIGYAVGKTITGKSADQMSMSLEFLLPVRLESSKTLNLHVTSETRTDGIFFHVENNQRVTSKGKIISNYSKLRQIDVKGLDTTIAISVKTDLNKTELYQKLASIGFAYGESFQMIERFKSNGSESLSNIEVPDRILPSTNLMTLHPCILDSVLQSTILTVEDKPFQRAQSENRIFLPVAIEEINFFRKPVRRMVIYTKLTDVCMFESTYQLHYDMILLTPEGEALVEVKNFMTYSKKTGTQASADLSYELTWYESKVASLNKQEPDPNIFFITRNCSDSDLKSFKERKQMTVFNREFSCAQSYVENAFLFLCKEIGIENIDVICFFVKSFSADRDVLNTEETLCLFNNISEDCQLLIELLRYLSDKNLSKPLYILTECTQMPTKSSAVHVSCNGAPMWGFVRSANVEFVAELVLVDLQPSLSSCLDSLLMFIRSNHTSISESPTEILIHCDKIYRSEFSKKGRFEKQLTASVHEIFDTREKHSVLQLTSTTSTDNCEFYLTNLKSQENAILVKDFVKLRVSAVTLPLKNVSLLAKLADPVRRVSTVLDAPVFATEYRGYISENKNSLGFLKCKSNVDSDCDNLDERWESIALYPATIFSEIDVPKKLVFSMKEFQRYQPGMLSISLVFWKMVKEIPIKSSVFINCINTGGLVFAILKQMLRSKKQCRVNDSVRTKNDSVVNLENIHNDVSGIQTFKRIYLFEEHVHPQTLVGLTSLKEKQVKVFNIFSVFSRAEIEKDIFQVVKWLKRNTSEILLLTNGNDTEFKEVLFKTLQVKQKKNGILAQKTSQNLFCKSDAYIITGGLSGLGWEQTKLMAENGAGIVATLTRKEPSIEVQAKIKQIESMEQCRIICLTGDVRNLQSVRSAFSKLKKLVPFCPIKGIFHCAGVSRGKTLATISKEDLEFVLKPKVLGTLNLHLVASEMSLPVDYFMATSSISSLIGSPGQSNYGAANSFIDTFMLWRRQRGLPGQAVNWGALEVGMAADPKLAQMFNDRGFNLMPVTEIRQCFQTCLLQKATGVVYATINWDLVSKYFTNQGMRRVKLQFMNVIKEMSSSVMKAETDNDDALDFRIDMLQRVDEHTRYTRLLFLVKYISSKLIGTDPEALNDSSTIAELPFDSMSTVILVNLLQEKTGYKIPDYFIADASHTLKDMANYLYKRLFN